MKNNISRRSFYIIATIIIVMLIVSVFEKDSNKLKYSELLKEIKTGNVTSIELDSNGDKAYVTLKSDEGKYLKEVNIPNTTAFMQYLNEKLDEGSNIEFEERTQNYLFVIIMQLLPYVIMLVVFLIFFNVIMGQQGGSRKQNNVIW